MTSSSPAASNSAGHARDATAHGETGGVAIVNDAAAASSSPSHGTATPKIRLTLKLSTGSGASKTPSPTDTPTKKTSAGGSLAPLDPAVFTSSGVMSNGSGGGTFTTPISAANGDNQPTLSKKKKRASDASANPKRSVVDTAGDGGASLGSGRRGRQKRDSNGNIIDGVFGLSTPSAAGNQANAEASVGSVDTDPAMMPVEKKEQQQVPISQFSEQAGILRDLRNFQTRRWHSVRSVPLKTTTGYTLCVPMWCRELAGEQTAGGGSLDGSGEDPATASGLSMSGKRVAAMTAAELDKMYGYDVQISGTAAAQSLPRTFVCTFEQCHKIFDSKLKWRRHQYTHDRKQVKLKMDESVGGGESGDVPAECNINDGAVSESGLVDATSL